MYTIQYQQHWVLQSLLALAFKARFAIAPSGECFSFALELSEIRDEERLLKVLLVRSILLCISVVKGSESSKIEQIILHII